MYVSSPITFPLARIHIYNHHNLCVTDMAERCSVWFCFLLEGWMPAVRVLYLVYHFCFLAWKPQCIAMQRPGMVSHMYHWYCTTSTTESARGALGECIWTRGSAYDGYGAKAVAHNRAPSARSESGESSPMAEGERKRSKARVAAAHAVATTRAQAGTTRAQAGTMRAQAATTHGRARRECQ
jgi:hypothetical protein